MGHRSCGSAFSWGTFDPEFIDELAGALSGAKVLEVFAGNGLLSAMLKARGIDVHATSLFRTLDGHQSGFHCDVEEIDARHAAIRYRETHDILLMSWPEPDETAMQTCLLWGEDRPVVFIGEVTDLEEGHLGGCASDIFFELSEEVHVFSSYSSARSGLDKAAIRKVLPGATAEFADRIAQKPRWVMPLP